MSDPPKEDDTNTIKTIARKVTKTIVTSPNVYKPVGPYSQAILADTTLYISGILGMDLEGKLVDGGAEGQARKALENLRHVVEAGGGSMESVVKCTILLGQMDDFQAVNKIYEEFFPRDFPARATFQVAKLPLEAAVEIEAIALSGDLVVAEAGPCPCAKDYASLMLKLLDAGKLPTLLTLVRQFHPHPKYRVWVSVELPYQRQQRQQRRNQFEEKNKHYGPVIRVSRRSSGQP